MDARGGLDLNELVIEDLSDSDHLKTEDFSSSNARMTSSAGVIKQDEGSKRANGSNTNASAGIEAVTGQTLSSDDLGGDDDDDDEV
jgi:hypothetical protein